MTPEQKLQALFAASKPPAQDYGFEIAVLERIAKHRAIDRFAYLAMWVVVMGSVMAAVFWTIEAGRVASLVPIVSAIAACGVSALVVWTMGRARAL